MICPHCHRKIPSEAVFCGACGRRVVGWKGSPHHASASGARPRASADPSDDTRKVRPNSELIRAAGGDPNVTRRMSPDSDLLRVVRGESEETHKARPSSSLIRAAASTDDSAPARPPPRLRADPQASAGGYEVDTAFLMEHALHPRRPRLAMLMIADACLLVVGIYLIVSWTLLPPSRNQADLAPTSSPGSRGYVDWNDNGQPARIATGPVLATFDDDRLSGGGDARPRAPDSPRPMSGGTPPPDASTTAKSLPMAKSMAGAETMDRPPSMVPAKADPAAVARARHLARVVAARDAFLKDVPRRIRGQRKAIHDCYRQTLRLFSNVKGFVDIEFMVGAGGRVTSARASRNTTRSKTLGSCISGVFLSTVFPKPPGGPVTLRYPFHFAPRKK